MEAQVIACRRISCSKINYLEFGPFLRRTSNWIGWCWVDHRKGVVQDSKQERDDVVIRAQVPLNEMFGYSTTLRSQTQGKGEFSMEYSHHAPVTQELQAQLSTQYGKKKKSGSEWSLAYWKTQFTWIVFKNIQGNGSKTSGRVPNIVCWTIHIVGIHELSRI